MPMASPRLLPRSAVVGSRICRSTSAGSTSGPPGPRWNRAQRSMSAAEDAMPPPGLSPRERRHSRPIDKRAVLAAVVTHGEPPGHDVVAVEEAADRPAGSKTSEAIGLLVGQPGDLLHDPPGQVEPRLAVGGPGARRRDQRQPGQRGYVAGQRVVPLAEVADDPPVQARGVIEQVEHGDLVRGPLVRQHEFGHVPPHRRIQRDLPVRDQAHHRGRGERLRHRADQEQSVLRDRQRVLHAGHAVTGEDLPPVRPHPDGRTGNPQPFRRLFHEPGQRRIRHDDPLPRYRLAHRSSPHPRHDLNNVQVQLPCPMVGTCRATR